MSKHVIGRLAFRVEGTFWNAYYAKASTMDDAILLGSIRLSIVTSSDERRQAFIDVIQDGMADELRDIAGSDLDWDIEDMPEEERIGNA